MQDINGFEKHNIDHLSASSINLWTNAPDVWVMQYLHGLRSPMGAAPYRGICVEDAVVSVLTGKMTTADAIAGAHLKFDKSFAIADEAVTKERNLIAGMTSIALGELEHLGAPTFPEDGQHKISIKCNGDGWQIPVIGYLDLVYPQHGLVIDLKTTTRIPSQMSPEHQLQRAIYKRSQGNFAVKFLYVSAKKSSLLEDGDDAEILDQAKLQIGRLEKFLRSVDRDAARDIVHVNPFSFYWRGAEDMRKKFYGI